MLIEFCRELFRHSEQRVATLFNPDVLFLKRTMRRADPLCRSDPNLKPILVLHNNEHHRNTV